MIAQGEDEEGTCDDTNLDWFTPSDDLVEVEVYELGCFRLSKTSDADEIGMLQMTGHVLKECFEAICLETDYTDVINQDNFITHSMSTAELAADTLHYFRTWNLRSLSGRKLSLTVSWTYVGIGSRRLRHETYFLGSSNPHASAGLTILPASVQVAEQLETAGMSSDITAVELVDDSPTPEPLATESTAATTSVGVWMGVGVGVGVLVMLVVLVIIFVEQKTGKNDTEDNKIESPAVAIVNNYKRVSTGRFTSNIAF